MVTEAAATDALHWARAHMRTERGDPLSFRDAPYLGDILLDDRPEHVVMKCAQSRMTITYLAKIFWRLCEQPAPGRGKARTCIYTFPTASDVTEFSAARAKPAIAASPYLTTAMGDTDNAGLKAFGNGSTIYFRGTWTDRAAISVPADILAHDELDRSKPDTLQIYSDRTRASDDPRLYAFSTPTVPGFGVSAHWDRTDQQEWVWSCADCGLEQVFAPADRSVSWTAGLDLESDPPAFRCISCGAPVSPEAVRRGQWVAMAPGVDVAGYHVTAIMVALADARRLAAEHAKATAVELFVQGHIGLPEVSGEQEITPDVIAFGDWRNANQSEQRLYAGLDQGKKLDLVVGDGQGRILGVHRLDDWAQVAQLMRTMHIRLLVADSAPDARPLQHLAAEFPRRVKLADYSLKTAGAKFFEVPESEPIRVRIHRTGALDWSAEQIIMGADGGDVWPVLPTAEREALVGMLCAPKRTMEKAADGNQRAVWVETAPDHLRHAHAYYLVAADIGGGRQVNIRYITQRRDGAEGLDAVVAQATGSGNKPQKLARPGEEPRAPAEPRTTDKHGREITPAELRKLQREGRATAARLLRGKP
jgi:hypothetical protein